MGKERITNYTEFYAFYLDEHQDKANRILHFVGTSIVILTSVLLSVKGIWANYWWILPLIGYGFAWVGHFFFEKNKPATFKYPLWSLFSDFKMCYQLWIGQLKF